MGGVNALTLLTRNFFDKIENTGHRKKFGSAKLKATFYYTLPYYG
jgi:hypothetical protein